MVAASVAVLNPANVPAQAADALMVSGEMALYAQAFLSQAVARENLPAVREFYFTADPLLAKQPIVLEPNSVAGSVSKPDATGSQLAQTQQSQLDWNLSARDIVAETKTTPPIASRIYALLSIAQFDALAHCRGLAIQFSPDPMLSERVAMSTAAQEVLKYFFPQAAGKFDAQSQIFQVGDALAVGIGAQIGQQVAAQIIAYHAGHGVPAADGYALAAQGGWYSADNSKPLLPTWGQMHTFVLDSPGQFRPAPPPLPGSAAFEAALKEVRAISDNRTPEQLANAQYWADGPGTFTPPGHWNQIASDLIKKNNLSDAGGVYILQVMNSAIADAGVACWDAKYTYNLIRPSQADPAITTPVGLPNFPAYPSGHATFSGAAATVLGYFFPSEAEALWRQAEQAAQSRVDGGIHYSFDGSEGLALGRKIGELAVTRGVFPAGISKFHSSGK